MHYSPSWYSPPRSPLPAAPTLRSARKEAQRIFTPQEPLLLTADSRPNDLLLADMNADGSPTQIS